ncbi:DUF1698 domain-containing protein, partial [Campylobacter jejuni]
MSRIKMQENLLEKQFLNHPLYAKIQELKALNLACNFSLDDSVNLSTNSQAKDEILAIAKELKPWRKGPFKIDDLFIDTEWQSFIKFNILKPFMNEISQKCVA